MSDNITKTGIVNSGLFIEENHAKVYGVIYPNLGNSSASYYNKKMGVSATANCWNGDAGTVTYYDCGGYNNYPYKEYHKTATGTGGIYLKTANDITIEANTTYTMSVWVKASRAFTDSSYSFNINRGSDNHYITYGTSTPFTTEWVRLTKTFTTGADEAGSYGEMSIIYDDNATDYYVYYSGFKIEKNNYATPYINPIIDSSNEKSAFDFNNFIEI